MPLRVAVLGAGVVGVCTSIELRRDGHDVTLVDPQEPGGPHAASYGNAGWLSPASVVPLSMPGLWRRVPGMLTDPLGPLTIRWSALPRLMPWLLRFLHSGATVARVEATARALRPLLASAPDLHVALASAAGVPDLICRNGLLYAFPQKADFDAEALAWRLRQDNGVVWEELEGDALRLVSPALADRYRFGALVRAGGHCRDPGRYVAALAKYAESLGVRRVKASATGFDLHGSRLRRALIAGGAVECDRAVISAGIWSLSLAHKAGDRPSLTTERGYHVVVGDPGVDFPVPVQPSDRRVGITPTTFGLRAAGQVELDTIDVPPDWRRAENLLRNLQAACPVVPTRAPPTTWMGHRPSTP
ncbi:MAG: FAD-binding oxidoreductase, partial [Rhodospirillales bacterium]|nr:FAD-binding oxidoreductase [Rhodospirillales bacterium]